MLDKLDSAFRTTWYGGSVQIFLKVSDLVDGLTFTSCMAAFLWAHYWSLGSLMKVYPRFLEGLLCNVNRCPGNYSPYPLVLLFLDEEGLVGRCPLLSDDIYFLFPSFILLCREREVKTEVNEKIKAIIAL